jgi:hypothetical protein
VSIKFDLKSVSIIGIEPNSGLNNTSNKNEVRINGKERNGSL